MATISPFVYSVKVSLSLSRIYFMCVYLPVRDFILFYPSHQPVNILLMQLANTFFACYFFGEKNVVVFFYIPVDLWLEHSWHFVEHETKEKMGRLFFFSQAEEIRECFGKYSFHCNAPYDVSSLPSWWNCHVSFLLFLLFSTIMQTFDADALHIYQTKYIISLSPFTWEHFMQTHFILWHFMVICMTRWMVCVHVCADWIYTDGDIETNVSACIAFNSDDTEPKLSSSTNKHQFMSWCFRFMWFWCFWPVDGLAVSFFIVFASVWRVANDVLRLMLMFMHTHDSLFSFFCNNRAGVSVTLWSFKEYLSIHRVELNAHTHTNTKSKSNFIASYVAVSFHFHFKAVINGFGLISHTKCAVCQCDLITRVCSFVFSTSDLSIRFLLLTVYSSNSLRFVLYA